MSAIQTLVFKLNNNGNGTANIDVRGLLVVNPGEGTVNCDCAVFGDDPIFDEVLFRFNRLQLGGELGQEFRFNIDKSFSALDEDRLGKDEIYAEVVLSKNISPGVPPEVLDSEEITYKNGSLVATKVQTKFPGLGGRRGVNPAQGSQRR